MTTPRRWGSILLQGHPPKQLLSSVLDLRYVENTDVAFNLLRWLPDFVRRPLLVTFGIVTIVGLSLVLVTVILRPSVGVAGRARAMTVALVLILAGALGNYLDRVVRGYVVDFIHVPYWPVFNVADILVTAGALLLLSTGWLSRSGAASVSPSV